MKHPPLEYTAYLKWQLHRYCIFCVYLRAKTPTPLYMHWMHSWSWWDQRYSETTVSPLLSFSTKVSQHLDFWLSSSIVLRCTTVEFLFSPVNLCLTLNLAKHLFVHDSVSKAAYGTEVAMEECRNTCNGTTFNIRDWGIFLPLPLELLH